MRIESLVCRRDESFVKPAFVHAGLVSGAQKDCFAFQINGYCNLQESTYNPDYLYRYRRSDMARITALEFQRKFGEFQHQARREPVEITRHGRRELVLMSADHYDWLVAAARRVGRTVEAADVVVDAVRRAEMAPELADLDDLMK